DHRGGALVGRTGGLRRQEGGGFLPCSGTRGKGDNAEGHDGRRRVLEEHRHFLPPLIRTGPSHPVNRPRARCDIRFASASGVGGTACISPIQEPPKFSPSIPGDMSRSGRSPASYRRASSASAVTSSCCRSAPKSATSCAHSPSAASRGGFSSSAPPMAI